MKKANKTDNYNNIFPTRLRKLMEKNNTKQSDLAKFLDISRQAVAQYKDGKAQPNIEMIVNIAEYFNVSSDYLLGITNVHTNDKDLKFVCEYTGLNEDAIEGIQNITEDEDKAYLLDLFLSSKSLYGIIFNLLLLDEYSFQVDSFYIEHKDIIQKEFNISLEYFLQDTNPSNRMWLADRVKKLLSVIDIDDFQKEIFNNTENSRMIALCKVNTYFTDLVNYILQVGSILRDKKGAEEK